MKKPLIAVSLLTVVIALASGQETTKQKASPTTKSASSPTKTLKSVKDRASYAIGMRIGRDMKGSPEPINLEVLIQGIRDTHAGKTPLLNDDEMVLAIETFGREIAAKQDAKNKVAGEKNKQEGEEFLAANKKKRGVKTLPSGLQYQILQAADGESPKKTDKVSVHYHGTLIDGTVFDSSIDRGEPISLEVSRFIDGWIEALQKMKVGEKWKLFIPSELAYKEEGSPPDIGPNATLIFELELLAIEE